MSAVITDKFMDMQDIVAMIEAQGGIRESRVVLDPGIGFGKSFEPPRWDG